MDSIERDRRASAPTETAPSHLKRVKSLHLGKPREDCFF